MLCIGIRILGRVCDLGSTPTGALRLCMCGRSALRALCLSGFLSCGFASVVVVASVSDASFLDALWCAVSSGVGFELAWFALCCVSVAFTGVSVVVGQGLRLFAFATDFHLSLRFFLSCAVAL